MAKAKKRSHTPERAVRLLEITAADVEASLARVRRYADPYRARLLDPQQGLHLEQMLAGHASDLERKCIEPIALMHDVPRHHLHYFMGQSSWDDHPLRALQWQEVSSELGCSEGALIVDGSSSPKKGEATCGVARQWCGRLGKVENCVVGVYGVYVGQDELCTLVDSQLFLPRSWADDPARREKAKVPAQERYQTQPELARQMVERLAASLPFAWVLADDEFGKVKAFRDRCFELGKSYVVDVPSTTAVVRVKKGGRLGKKCFSAKELVRSRPKAEWQELWVRDAEKGPLEVRALALPVVTERPRGGRVKETLLVLETLDGAQRWYCLARTQQAASLEELVRRARQRHHIEQVFAEAKGEVGLDHFEVRSWVGWHHHMTLCQLAHWFLLREKRRLGKKSGGAKCELDPAGAGRAAGAAAESGAKRAAAQLPPPTQPRGQRSSLSRLRAPPRLSRRRHPRAAAATVSGSS